MSCLRSASGTDVLGPDGNLGLNLARGAVQNGRSVVVIALEVLFVKKAGLVFSCHPGVS